MSLGFAHQLFANALLVLPVFAPIGVGYCLKRRSFMPDAFWPQVDRLTYFVLLPALIANALATMPLAGGDAGPLVTALLIGLTATSLALYAVCSALRISGADFGPLFHACIRPNGYLGIAAGLAVLGSAGLGPLALVIAVWAPLGLTLATVGFQLSEPVRPVRLAKQVAVNPLVSSVAIGLALNVAGAGPLLSSTRLLETIGQAAVAIGLISVGAALNLRALRSSGPVLAAAVIVGLMAMPAMMAGIGAFFALDEAAIGALVIFAAMPTSPSGFVMARQMGANAPLMGAIISAQTLASILTIALAVTLLL